MGHCILLTLIICVKSLNLMKRAQIHFLFSLIAFPKLEAGQMQSARCCLKVRHGRRL